MRFLLRPGWLAFIGVVCAFVVACYTLLAPWQFDREAEREAQNAAIAAADGTPAVPFAELVPPGEAVSPDDIWRRVELTGTFEQQAESLVRLRVVDGAPAYEVLTPLRLDDGRLVVVNRGTIAGGEGGVVPEFAPAPTGTVNIEGRLRLNENDPQDRPPLHEGGTTQIYAADSRAVAEATGTDPVEGVVTLDEGQPGVLNPIPIAPPAGGAPFSNFSYALQWLTFGLVALVALGIFIRLELLQRRGGRETRGSLRDQLSGRDGYGSDDGPGEHTDERTAERTRQRTEEPTAEGAAAGSSVVPAGDGSGSAEGRADR